MNPLLTRIAIDPAICFGKTLYSRDENMGFPHLGLPRRWYDQRGNIARISQLVAEDVRAAIAYGAEMSRERYVDLPLEVAT